MQEAGAGPNAAGRESLTKVAAGLATAAVLTMVVLSAMDADGPIWILQGVLAGAAAVTAWRAGGTTPRNPVAFAALIVGTVLFLLFAGFLVAEA
jgi:hypothetical protein